jgi:phosphatidylglycerophosphatase A
MNKFPDLKKFSHLSSTFFGVGLLPIAPGTWGSFAALFLFFGLIYLQICFLLYFLFVIFFSIASIIICEIASKDLVEKDQKTIVIDEVAGAGLSFLFIPFLGIYNFSTLEWQKESYLAALILIILFRFFDILKPYPISFIDREFKSGFGIVLDDLVAGVFAGLTLLGGNFFFQIF